MPANQIEVWTYPPELESRSALPPRTGGRPEVTHIDPERLAENLRNVIAAFESALETSPAIKRSLEIDTIELKLGISANGGIALIGKVEAGLNAGITVTLKRPKPE